MNPLNEGLGGKSTSIRGRKSVKVFSVMGAIRSRSPAEREGITRFTRSCSNDFLSSFRMLPEKSTKIMRSIPGGVVVSEEAGYPVAGSAPPRMTKRIQAVMRRGIDGSPSMRTTIGIAHGHFPPPFQIRILGTFSKRWRSQQLTEPRVGLPVQGDALAGEGSDFFDVPLGPLQFPVHLGADPVEFVSNGVTLPVLKDEGGVGRIEPLIRV